MRAKFLLPALWYLVFPLPDVAYAQSASTQESPTACIEIPHQPMSNPDHYRVCLRHPGRPQEFGTEVILPAGKGFDPDRLRICGLEPGLYDISVCECKYEGDEELCGPPVTYSGTAKDTR